MSTYKGSLSRQPLLVKLLNNSIHENRVVEPKPFQGCQYVNFEPFR